MADLTPKTNSDARSDPVNDPATKPAADPGYDTGPNPYAPPAAVSAKTRQHGLRNLLRQTTRHHLLLLMFAIMYLGASALTLLSDGILVPGLMAVLGLWLLLCTWWLSYSGSAVWLRLLLSMLAPIPVLNLVVPLINHHQLSDLARSIDIPVSSFGPDADVIEEQLAGG
ncbi:MAG: hypothetical protein HKN70_12135 [Gammaproteobacteria bacterium]|nr:hypothetical protein [Gammaproteobacteria bacterium]